MFMFTTVSINIKYLFCSRLLQPKVIYWRETDDYPTGYDILKKSNEASCDQGQGLHISSCHSLSFSLTPYYRGGWVMGL